MSAPGHRRVVAGILVRDRRDLLESRMYLFDSAAVKYLLAWQ
jgi:hypothetical protein